MKRQKKKRTRNQILIEIADILFAKAIKIRDGYKCRKTGVTNNLECSHIMSRAYKRVRWDMDNAFTLNNGIHRYWWHMHPIDAAEWAKEQMGTRAYNDLYRRSRGSFKLTTPFIEQKILELKKFIAKHEDISH